MQPWPPARSWAAFALLLVVQLWAAHAIGYLVHEYSHAALAWLLGWKANPLALHYGSATAVNLLLQSEIDENVDYAPIFAGGHGWQAGFIAAAGAAIGNFVLTYGLGRWGLAVARGRGWRGSTLLSYWICVMSVGNFIDYVPIRTFSPREDMSTVARGFDCSPWWILLVLGVPFGIATIHFLLRLQPRTLGCLLPDAPLRRAVLVLLTASLLFGFFGASGWSNSGAVSHLLSVISVWLLFPAITLLGWWLNRSPPPETGVSG